MLGRPRESPPQRAPALLECQPNPPPTCLHSSFLPLSAGHFALLLSYLPVYLPVFLWPTLLSQTFWGLTFQAPHWAFLIFVYLFSAVSPPLLGYLLACLLEFLILPVFHPFFFSVVGVSALLGAGSLLPGSDPGLALWLPPSSNPVFVAALAQSSLGGKAEQRKNDACGRQEQAKGT